MKGENFSRTRLATDAAWAKAFQRRRRENTNRCALDGSERRGEEDFLAALVGSLIGERDQRYVVLE